MRPSPPAFAGRSGRISPVPYQTFVTFHLPYPGKVQRPLSKLAYETLSSAFARHDLLGPYYLSVHNLTGLQSSLYVTDRNFALIQSIRF